MKQTRTCALSIPIFLFVILFFSAAFTQTITWEKKFYSANDGSVVQTLTDGGYIAAGGYGPSAIIRTNAQGDSTWGKAIDLNAYGIRSVADGYVLSGMLNSHPYVIKLDQSGAKVWDRYIGGNGMYDNADGIIATFDALYITGTFYNNDQTYSLFITKLSLAGDSIWQTTLGKHTTTNGRALTNTNGVGIAQTSDGFVVCGTADSEIYLVKFDQNGNKVWDHSYPGIHSISDVDVAHSVAVTSDGGYILCGVKALSNASFNTVIILLKTTSDGTQTWRQSVGNPGGVGQQVLVESDGYALTGWIGNNGHIIKTDLQGTTVWDQQLGAGSTYGLDKGKDGSYTAVGSWADGSMYLGNVKAGTAPPPDKQTYIYRYHGQPVYKFHTDSPNGWVGIPGGISTPGNSVVSVNDGIDLNTIVFSIDTFYKNVDSITFKGFGSLVIRTSPLSSKMSTFGPGDFEGHVLGSNIIFDTVTNSASALTCKQCLSGLTMSLKSVNPGPFPIAASVRGNGTMSEFRNFYARNSSKVGFSSIVFNSSTIELSTLGDLEVGPGDYLGQITSSYDLSRDRLNLNGTFVSSILFPAGVPASTFIEKGNIVRIKVDQPLGTTIGRGTPYRIDSLFAYVTPGPSAHILGRFSENSGATELYQVDLTDSYFNMPIDLHQRSVNFRAFKTGDQNQIIGNANFDAKWDNGFAATTLNSGTIKAGILPDTKLYIFDGRFNSNSYFFMLHDGMYFSHDANGQWSLTGRARGTANMPDLTHVTGLSFMAKIARMLYPPGSSFNAYVTFRNSVATLHLYTSSKSQVAGSPSAISVELHLNKLPSDPNFLSINSLDPKLQVADFITSAHKNHAEPASTKIDTLRIANNVSGAYIMLKGVGNPPIATLTDPNGKQIMQSLSDSTVMLLSIDSHERWWVLDHPIPGNWLINTAGSTGDSIIAYVINDTDPFAITVSQTNRNVHVNWGGTASANTAVSVYISKDTSGGSLQLVASAKRSDGSATFDLTDDMPECNYYVYAVSDGDGSTQEARAITQLSNAKSILASPTGINATYSKKDTGVVVTWNKATDPNIIGYAIRLTGNGIDSTVASPYGFQTQSTFSLLSPDGMFISMISYDSLGRTGCWSDPIALGAADVETPRTVTAPDIAVAVMPNPSAGRTSLQITLKRQNNISISVYDEAGREVVTLPETTFGSGSFTMNLGTESLSSGSYTALVRAGENLQTVRFVIQK